MTAKIFLEGSILDDKYELISKLQKHRLKGEVENEMEDYAEYKLKEFITWYLNLSIEELNWYEDKYVYSFLNSKEWRIK